MDGPSGTDPGREKQRPATFRSPQTRGWSGAAPADNKDAPGPRSG